jgi:glutamine synthetase adenylyltransferase
LSEKDATRLRDGYRFMRRLENFIQAIRDRQTHELPADDVDRARLCLAMGYPDWQALVEVIEVHRGDISSQFEQVAFRDNGIPTPLREHVEQAWESGADEATWIALLEQDGVGNTVQVAGALVGFANDTATRQIDATSRERLQRFIPLLVAEVAKSGHFGRSPVPCQSSRGSCGAAPTSHYLTKITVRWRASSTCAPAVITLRTRLRAFRRCWTNFSIRVCTPMP